MLQDLKFSRSAAFWCRWDRVYESDNDPVDEFPLDQIFLVFFIEDGGMDLESYPLNAFQELKSLLLQVSIILFTLSAPGNSFGR